MLMRWILALYRAKVKKKKSFVRSAEVSFFRHGFFVQNHMYTIRGRFGIIDSIYIQVYLDAKFLPAGNGLRANVIHTSHLQ
jgi:hypothetical protein